MSGLLYALAGLAAGVLSGMGMGGGTVLIPLLTLFMEVGQRAAQGVNMLAFLPGALFAILVHWKHKRIDWKAALPLVLSGAAGAILGAFLATALDASWLRRGFGGFLVVLAFVEWRTGEKKNRTP